MSGPTRFPQTRAFQGGNAPARIEASIFDLEVVQGEVPGWLHGEYFRVQPDPAWPPRLGDDVPLNGDGMITKFSFADGHVDFLSRYVRTEKFLAERAARRALFGAYRNPFTDDPSVSGISRGTANTALAWHAGRLLALKEDSHPVQVNPGTLDTIGPVDFDGLLTSRTFTAHPKLDPETGQMLAFGYEATGDATPDIAYYVIDATGKIVRELYFRAPYAAMVHDFAVTKDFVLFPISPLISDAERLKAGLPHFAWDGSRETYLGVLPRQGEPSELRWFRGPASFSSHTMNAWSEGSRIFFDTPTGNIVVFPFFPDIAGVPWNAEAARPYLERWSVDMAHPGEEFSRERLSDLVVEFPRIDPRASTGRYRHGWTVGQDHPAAAAAPTSLAGSGHWNAIVHFDHAEGKSTRYRHPAGGSFQEPEFVARSADAAEGEGVLLTIVSAPGAGYSDLLVLSATQLDSGPLATVRIPFRIRNGLHGTWVEGEGN